MHKMKRILAVCMLALFMGVFFGAPARQAALPVVQAEAAQVAGNSNNATGFLDGITYNKGANGSCHPLLRNRIVPSRKNALFASNSPAQFEGFVF